MTLVVGNGKNSHHFFRSMFSFRLLVCLCSLIQKVQTVCVGLFLLMESSQRSPLGPVRSTWDLIWNLKSLPRVKTVLWITAHGRLGTSLNYAKRGIVPTATCQRCHQGDESIIHALRDCNFSKKVWQEFNVVLHPPFFTDDLPAWLSNHFENHTLVHGIDTCWNHVFAVAVW